MMKNNKIRNLLLSGIICCSIFSFYYINSSQTDFGSTEKTNTDTVENEEDKKSEILLPDVKVIKAILETGKKLLPNSVF